MNPDDHRQWLRMLARNAPEVAPDLIGCRLISTIGNVVTGGRIVEAEAYTQDDPACHAYHGRRPRNLSLFGPSGHAYVYRSYGVHWCVNMVTGEEGIGQGVLIRALEPEVGIDIMRQRRGIEIERLLCSGPGRVGQALAITGDLDGSSVCGPYLYLYPPERSARRIARTPRIGVTLGAERLWRFVDADSRYLSRGYQKVKD